MNSGILNCVLFLVLVLVFWRLARSFYKFFKIQRKAALSGSFSTDEHFSVKQTLDKHYDSSGPRELNFLKDLYFKLQNLELYPEVLSVSRDVLICMFSETLRNALGQPQSNILSVERYTSDNLRNFLRKVESQISHEWERYLERRRAGSSRQLFENAEEARHWLTQNAPVKFVDGAWLGHVNRITAPFSFRRSGKDAWQIFSEELGDGDLGKHHVYLYNQLLEEVGSQLPLGHHADFLDSQRDNDDLTVWGSAVAQLLISLFPNEFYPEILGFNLHFEMLTLRTIIAAHELKELRINPYYFLLHITIDNSDSGHTAMAQQAVVKYMDEIRAQRGDSAVQQAWKRIQAGFILSERIASEPLQSLCTKQLSGVNEYTYQVAKIFAAKAAASEKIHCNSKIRIGRRKLDEWLSASSMGDEQWQLDFLDDLSRCRPWVKPGNPEESKLIQELRWGGRMFGSFTYNELDVVKNWIEFLDKRESALYWSFVGRTETTSVMALKNQDITSDYPVFSETADSIPVEQPILSSADQLWCLPHISITVVPKLLPLLFTHQCLLEGFLSVPSRTTDALHCAVIRLLRSQYGFGIERAIVDGIDEARRTDSLGLVEVAFELTRACGVEEPASLQEVLEKWPSDFSRTMLHLAMRPMGNKGMLLGMTDAFVTLHKSIAMCGVLSSTTARALDQITVRERDCLSTCLQEIEGDEEVKADFFKGRALAQKEIERCFE